MAWMASFQLSTHPLLLMENLSRVHALADTTAEYTYCILFCGRLSL